MLGCTSYCLYVALLSLVIHVHTAAHWHTLFQVFIIVPFIPSWQ